MKRWIGVISLLLGCGLVASHVGLRINLTASMPRGIYRISPDSAPERGDLVTFCLENPGYVALARERGYLRPGSCQNELEPLLKLLVGTAGDHVYLTRDGVWLNGDLLPDSQVRIQDSLKRPLPPTSLRSGRIPDGMALVMSNGHPGSFDSRYFGLVPLASLTTVQVVKLFEM